jgi:hypothetical protein
MKNKARGGQEGSEVSAVSQSPPEFDMYQKSQVLPFGFSQVPHLEDYSM